VRRMGDRDEMKWRDGQKRAAAWVMSGKMRAVGFFLDNFWRGKSLYILQVETKADIHSSDLMIFSATSRYSHGHAAIQPSNLDNAVQTDAARVLRPLSISAWLGPVSMIRPKAPRYPRPCPDSWRCPPPFSAMADACQPTATFPLPSTYMRLRPSASPFQSTRIQQLPPTEGPSREGYGGL
jgi:hypothetical protein